MLVSRRRLLEALPVMVLAPEILAAENPGPGALNLSPNEVAALERSAERVVREARLLLELPLAEYRPALGCRPKVIQTPGFSDVQPPPQASERRLPEKPSELCFLSLADAAELIRSRSISPLQLTQAHLERIERLDSRLRSFITVTAERTVAEAKAAGGEIARGRYRGPLHGIPRSIKDSIATAGIRTTYACGAFADWVPERDATVVTRRREAGAVPLGKANLFEVTGVGTSEQGEFKPARNPWNPTLQPVWQSGHYHSVRIQSPGTSAGHPARRASVRRSHGSDRGASLPASDHLALPETDAGWMTQHTLRLD